MDELAAHRVVLLILDDHRLGGAAVDYEVEHGAGLGQRQAQLAAVDREGGGLVAAAVDDAGDLARATQAAHRARALGAARGHLQGRILAACHGGEG